MRQEESEKKGYEQAIGEGRQEEERESECKENEEGKFMEEKDTVKILCTSFTR